MNVTKLTLHRVAGRQKHASCHELINVNNHSVTKNLRVAPGLTVNISDRSHGGGAKPAGMSEKFTALQFG